MNKMREEEKQKWLAALRYHLEELNLWGIGEPVDQEWAERRVTDFFTRTF